MASKVVSLARFILPRALSGSLCSRARENRLWRTTTIAWATRSCSSRLILLRSSSAARAFHSRARSRSRTSWARLRSVTFCATAIIVRTSPLSSRRGAA